MAKASLTLANGTVVHLEGTPEEVRNLLELYGGKQSVQPPKKKRRNQGSADRKKLDDHPNSSVDVAQIVNLTKDCDEADQIETRILDRSSQVDRTLLPLYIVHEYLQNAFGLTSGEVNKVTTDLGIPISQPNASKTLSGTASRYVMGDRVKQKGQPVRYKLSRRGLQYMKAVLSGTESEG
jgi:hypothetical protein